jgi:branched-chain amino acid transport system permease protein
MYGTFAAAWVVMAFGGNDNTSTVTAVLILLVALVAAMLTSGAVALFVERVAYRPLLKRGAPKLAVLISAIGTSFVLAEAMGLRDKMAGWFGLQDNLSDYVTGARIVMPFNRMLPNNELFTIGDYTVRFVDLLVVVSAFVMMVGVDQFIRRSRLGRGIRSVAQDPESAALMGVNATRVVQTTFLIGGLMAGAAAFLYIVRIEATKYDVGFILGVKAFTAAVLGGIGNLRGALLGGLVLGVAENYGSAFFGTEWKDVIAFILLVLILMFRPTGLLGESLGKARA